MLRLRFGGWFQCRLATDPDPADEPRGVSGSIKALPGEPDLDRIIRLQPPPSAEATPVKSGSKFARCGWTANSFGTIHSLVRRWTSWATPSSRGRTA